MNSIAAITALYFLLALSAAMILCYSFWRKFDASAKLFLTAEVCVMITAAMIFSVNYFPSSYVLLQLFLSNLMALSAEIFVYFGLISFTKKFNKYALSSFIILGLIYSVTGQYIRSNFGANFAIIFISIPFIFVVSFSVLFCNSKKNLVLSNNQFFRWIGWFEFGLLVIWITRFFSGFSNYSIDPRNPTDLAIFIFSGQIVFSIFRYFSYVGLRATLITESQQAGNKLNAPLVASVLENNSLVSSLISSNRMIGVGALASSLAHQLSQPLTSISFRAASAKKRAEKLLGQPELVTSINAISSESEKLVDLVSNLRGLFANDTPKGANVNLQEIANQIIEFFDASLIDQQISINKNFLAQPVINGDSIQLQQVLINLLNNATDAINAVKSKNRIITITITQEDGMAIISIADTGTGIRPEQKDKIFDLYQSTKKFGLGVGLWLSRRIVEQHHGIIEATNSVNGGAIFTIRLPMNPSAKDKA